MSIYKILGGLVVFGLATGCSGKSSSGEPQAVGGGAGAGSGGLSSAGSDGGTEDTAAGATGESGGAGEAGADDGVAGTFGNAGASGNPGSAGSGGSLGGAGGNLGNAGSGGKGYPTIDIGAQKTSDKLDVLFVVDNSVSMADKQNILSVSLPSFVKRLVNPLCVDALGKPVATQPASGSAACITGSRELIARKRSALGRDHQQSRQSRRQRVRGLHFGR